jgi:hypothetical protein
LDQLLHEVVVGHASLQTLNGQCALIKARMRVQTAILSDVKLCECNDLEVAKTMFPLSCHDDFVERWALALVREGLKAREALPETFHTELERRANADVANRTNNNADMPVCHGLININAMLLTQLNAVCICLYVVFKASPGE